MADTRVGEFLVVTPYSSTGASRRVRVDGWLRHLGVDAAVIDYLGTRDNRPRTLVRRPGRLVAAERRVRRDASGARCLLLQREASPLSRGTVEARLLSSAGYGVYDFDDALQWDHGSGLRRFLAKPQKCLAAVRSADLVIAGNDVLATWASEHSRRVLVIPSCVEPDDYETKSSYALHDPPQVVWIGSPSTERHLAVAAPALLELRRRTGAVLRVVSTGSASLGPLDEMVERVEWSFDAAASAAVDADIAIAPLFDGLFERGKCAYKLLQYGATGLPVVGSPVGANERVLRRMGSIAASTDDEWAEGLTRWLEMSEEKRAGAGATARDAVRQGFSYAAWSTVWRRAVGV